MKLEQSQPIVIIRGMPKHPTDGYLVCEKSLLSISVADLPIVICHLATMFSICSTVLGAQFFSIFVMVIFLNIAALKKTKINHLLNMVDNVD